MPILAPEVPEPFAGGRLGALHQLGRGGEVLDGGEAIDVVDLVEDHQSQDLADARHRAQAGEGVDVMDLGGLGDVELDLIEEPIVVIDQRQVHRHGLPHAGVGKPVGHPRAVRLVGGMQPTAFGRG